MRQLLTAFVIIYFCCGAKAQVVINELGIAPSGGDPEFIELYNKSSCSIDLSCYTLIFSSTSGGGNPTGWTIKIPAGKSIPACGYFFIGGQSGAIGAGGTGYPTGGVVTSYPTANLDVGTIAITANAVYMKLINAGTLSNASGQITLLNSAGMVAASVSYNNGNNAATYPLSAYTTCSASGNTQGNNNIPDPGASGNNINAVFTAAGNQGIYLDAFGIYQTEISLTPGISNTANGGTQIGCAPSIAISPNAADVCFNSLTTTLSYSATTGSPSNYSISWNTTPSNSFVPVINAILPASPITINVPAGTSPGTYTGNISVSNATVGSCSLPFTITVHAAPIVTVSPDSIICSGGTGITLTASGAVNYNWSPSTGLSATTGVTITANPPSTTTYTVTGTDNNGCQDTAIVTIATPPAPTNIIACIAGGQSYNLGGQILTASGQYTTTFTSAGGCDSVVNLYLVIAKQETADLVGCESVIYNGITYTSSTVLSQTISSQLTGCDSIIRTINIVVHPKPQLAIITPDITICAGQAVTLRASASNALIEWLGTANTNDITVSPATSTTYTVVATNSNGCKDTASVTVSVSNFNLQLFASVNPAITGTTVYLQSTANASYQVLKWMPAVFTNPSAYIQPLVSDTTINVMVVARSADNCMDSASVKIIADPLGDIFIPSAFTPNRDGKNDVFKVLGETIESLDLKVFNRWSGLIFSSNERSKGWDGTYAGKLQPGGVYVYMLTATLKDGRIIRKKGTVTLIR